MYFYYISLYLHTFIRCLANKCLQNASYLANTIVCISTRNFLVCFQYTFFYCVSPVFLMNLHIFNHCLANRRLCVECTILAWSRVLPLLHLASYLMISYPSLRYLMIFIFEIYMISIFHLMKITSLFEIHLIQMCILCQR